MKILLAYSNGRIKEEKYTSLIYISITCTFLILFVKFQQALPIVSDFVD